MHLAVDPVALLADETRVLIDVRPESERYGGSGFIPGSISVPYVPTPTRLAADIQAAVGRRAPVLVCLSGARACVSARALAPLLPTTPAYLRGGVLAWRNEELPLSGRGHSPDRLSPETPSASPRPDLVPLRLARAFLDEIAATSLAGMLDTEALLRACFSRAGVDPHTPDPMRLTHVIDHAARAWLDLGTPMSRVAVLVDDVLELLAPPAIVRAHVA